MARDDSRMTTLRGFNSQVNNSTINNHNPDVSILSDFQFDNSKGLYSNIKRSTN